MIHKGVIIEWFFGLSEWATYAQHPVDRVCRAGLCKNFLPIRKVLKNIVEKIRSLQYHFDALNFSHIFDKDEIFL